MIYQVIVTPVPYVGNTRPEGATPEEAGLEQGGEYLTLDLHDYGGVDGEAYFAVVNGSGEVWFISNRHLRVSTVFLNGNLIAEYLPVDNLKD